MKLEIMTKRCIVRKFILSDINDFMEYRNDEEWMKYQGFKGLSKEEYIANLINDDFINEGVQLAIIERSMDKVIGDLYIKKENEICWIGFTVNPMYSRKGYAQETVTGLLAWLKGNVVFDKVCASVLPGNLSSNELLTKLGFVFSYCDEENVYCLES